ncbi:APC family permease [Actinoplanes oblitus]|uniref:APC family permease n=1 Tax=Actinoplanes oblitus TaxID=3040509 RepID=A0ABY8WIM5_9ACTN|nr:APC family permease [Actinoplanes oblitus]WIM96916.1 APC family permease [Actinoplanes oblitus]
MESVGTAQEPPHPAPSGLARGRIGAVSAALFGVAAAAPIATVVTVVTVSPPVLAAGAGPLAALSVVAVAVVLLLFGTPYAAMIRRTPHAGATYPQLARGLGRPAALVGAWLALAGYHAIQFGLYALLGQAAAPLLHSWFGVTAPWWLVAGAGWLLVTLGGLLRVEFAAGVIALLTVAETAVLAGLAAAGVLRPAGGAPIRTGTYLITDPARLDRSLLGLLLAVAVLAFVGFETAATYAEETRDPRRTAGRAARGAVLLLALLLAGVTWSLIVAAGPAGVAGRAAARGPELLFALAGERLAPWAVTLARLMLVTGLLAAILAVHHALARYLYALGRERVLPGVLGNVSPRTGAPRAAALTQSLVAGAALTGAYLAGATASARTARALVVGGGLAILVLLLLTAVAALLHLNRVPAREGVGTRFFAPVLSIVSLGVLLYLAGRDLAALLAVRAGSPWVSVVLGALAGCLAIGLAHALVLRLADPVRYAGIGLGGAALVITPQPGPAAEQPTGNPRTWAAPPGDAPEEPADAPAGLPRQRTPGAHRPERVHPEING